MYNLVRWQFACDLHQQSNTPRWPEDKERRRSSLTRPNLISNRSDQFQLLSHIFIAKRVSFCVTGKSTLRRNTNLQKSLFSTLTGSFSDKVCCLVHSLDHVLRIFQLGEFWSDDTKNDIFVLWEIFEWFESTCSWSIVFEVVRVDVQVLHSVSKALECS